MSKNASLPSTCMWTIPTSLKPASKRATAPSDSRRASCRRLSSPPPSSPKYTVSLPHPGADNPGAWLRIAGKVACFHTWNQSTPASQYQYFCGIGPCARSCRRGVQGTFWGASLTDRESAMNASQASATYSSPPPSLPPDPRY